jgi:HEAT repeat protein
MNMNRIPPLVERVRNGEPKVRREALLALSRLQHQAIADEVQADLAAELDSGGAIDLRLIWALGYLQHADSLPILDKALYHPDETVQRLAAWSISQHRDSGKGREAADLLEQRLPAAPLVTKCAIVHSLGVLSDERSNLALMHAYDSASPEEREFLCRRMSISASPDGERDHEDLLAPSERFAMKILQTMGAVRATAPEIRAQIEPWIQAMMSRADTSPLIREAAQSLLDGIRSQRNDLQ